MTNENQKSKLVYIQKDDFEKLVGMVQQISDEHLHDQKENARERAKILEQLAKMWSKILVMENNMTRIVAVMDSPSKGGVETRLALLENVVKTNSMEINNFKNKSIILLVGWVVAAIGLLFSIVRKHVGL